MSREEDQELFAQMVEDHGLAWMWKQVVDAIDVEIDVARDTAMLFKDEAEQQERIGWLERCRKEALQNAVNEDAEEMKKFDD